MRYDTPYTHTNGRVGVYPYGPNYELDEETGLPKVLRDGDYFRIVPAATQGWFRVQYKRPRRLWSAETMAQEIVAVSAGARLSQDVIMYHALCVLSKAMVADSTRKEPTPKKPKLSPEQKAERKAKQKMNAQIRRENSRFVGKYPPKHLGAGE